MSTEILTTIPRLGLSIRPAVAVLAAALCAAVTSIGACDKHTRNAEFGPAGSAAPACPSEGASPMTRDTLLEQLRALNEAKVEALGSSLAAAARTAPRAAVDLSQSADADTSLKAKRLLIAMADVAIEPIAEAPIPAAPEERIFLIGQAVEAEVALRRKVIRRLDALLDDQTPMPAPKTRGPVEQKAPRRRVCDEAYLMMRRLVHLGEDPLDASVQANMFLNAPEDFKDAQIKKARASDIWNRAITGKDVADYDASHPEHGTRPPSPR